MKKLMPIIAILLVAAMIYMVYTNWKQIRQTDLMLQLLGEEEAGPATYSQADSCQYKLADGTFIPCSDLCDSTLEIKCSNPPCPTRKVPCDHPNAIPKQN